MAGIEIKGLGDSLTRARAAIARARGATSSLEQTVTDYITDVETVESQVKQHHDDLRFEAQTLGNSPPATGESVKPKEQPKIVAGTAVLPPAQIADRASNMVAHSGASVDKPLAGYETSNALRNSGQT